MLRHAVPHPPTPAVPHSTLPTNPIRLPSCIPPTPPVPHLDDCQRPGRLRHQLLIAPAVGAHHGHAGLAKALAGVNPQLGQAGERGGHHARLRGVAQTRLQRCSSSRTESTCWSRPGGVEKEVFRGCLALRPVCWGGQACQRVATAAGGCWIGCHCRASKAAVRICARPAGWKVVPAMQASHSSMLLAWEGGEQPQEEPEAATEPLTTGAQRGHAPPDLRPGPRASARAASS
jgi:hypothetical protein